LPAAQNAVDGPAHRLAGRRDAIAASNQPDVATTFRSGLDKFVAYYNRAHAPGLNLIARNDWCSQNPHWLVIDARLTTPLELTVHADGCRLHFAHVHEYLAGGFSPTAWSVYHLRDVDGERLGAEAAHPPSAFD
jgi:hypothetical protein